MENKAVQEKPKHHSFKGNKGYYTLLLGDTVVFSIMTSVNLMLISLPLSVLMGAINFGVNIFAGIKAEPAPAHKGSTPQIAALTADGRKPKKSLFKFTGAFAKKARRFISKTMRDPKVVVGSEGAAAGGNILFQTLWGIHSVVTTHSLLFLGAVTGLAATATIAGCAVVGAFGLFCMVAGTVDKWKGFSKFFTSSFREGSHASAPPVERPSRWLAKRPRLQKFMNSKFARRTKDTLMILLTLEASIFVIGASTALIAQRVSGIISKPKTFLAGIVPLAIAINWGKTPVINFIAVGRLTLGRHVKKLINKMRKKPAAAKMPSEAAPEALLVPVSAGAGSTFPETSALAQAFNNKTAKSETENKAAPEEKPAGPGGSTSGSHASLPAP